LRSVTGIGCTTTFLSMMGRGSGCRPFITCS
jgi:hypothetical protein